MKKINKIIEILEQVNASDIKAFDYEKKSPFFDYIIIATTNERQSTAAVSYMKKEELVNYKNSEGKDNSGWVLIDTGDTIIHLFNSEQRKYYNFDERLLGIKKLEV
ncbi:ribosome silencing factor [Haploplasma axanthum]|uniref:Ribosome-associated protein n=1 Tax=Haploplasma axanthum TaxID=29552 RepID=A0A449BDZ1_HAPAX|nr:ribosome silencing factor [Haploplasma axanthum]VEU80673.1 ribosome-associated protein [Haploplasma axanthum]